MQKFAIFEKSNNFYWSTNRIVYSILFVGLGILLLKNEVFHFKPNVIDKIFQFILIATLICSLFFMFVGLTKVKPLRGKLDGFITFEENYIEIKEEKIPIEQIRNIKISNDDYNGKLQTSRGNFGPALSNGTNNFIVIFLESGKSMRIQYELYNADDFQKIRPVLIKYYLKHKIEFWELANVLGEESSAEIRDLNMEIEKASTTANSRLA